MNLHFAGFLEVTTAENCYVHLFSLPNSVYFCHAMQC